MLDELREELRELNPDALLADGFEDALIGIGQQFNRYLAVYSLDKARQVLIDRDGMRYEDAQEFIDIHVTGAWMGDNTPIFLYVPESLPALKENAESLSES